MPKASVKRLIDNKKEKLIDFVLDIEKYLKHMNSKVNKCEKKLSDMGIIKQSNYLKTYLTEEQINNVINICNDDGMIWEGEDVD